MQPWQLAALGASCLIALHYLLVRAAAGRIGDSLGALLLEGTAAVGIALAFAGGLRGGTQEADRVGVACSVLSGLCISGASILLFFALRRGGPVASTGMIVLGGGVVLSALVAPLLFREAVTPRRALGIVLGLASLAVQATEGTGPNEPVAVEKEGGGRS